MQYNAAMKKYLDKIDLNEMSGSPAPSGKYRITQRINRKGEPYWRVGAFWHADTRPEVRSGNELTDLEWAGNECSIDTTRPRYDIVRALRQALVVMYQWKRILAKRFPTMSFDLFLSIDEADDDFQIANHIHPSVTFRFTAVRSGYHFIEMEADGHDFVQPFLYMSCTPQPEHEQRLIDSRTPGRCG
jgi:hypothetical protein